MGSSPTSPNNIFSHEIRQYVWWPKGWCSKIPGFLRLTNAGEKIKEVSTVRVRLSVGSLIRHVCHKIVFESF